MSNRANVFWISLKKQEQRKRIFALIKSPINCLRLICSVIISRFTLGNMRDFGPSLSSVATFTNSGSASLWGTLYVKTRRNIHSMNSNSLTKKIHFEKNFGTACSWSSFFSIMDLMLRKRRIYDVSQQTTQNPTFNSVVVFHKINYMHTCIILLFYWNMTIGRFHCFVFYVVICHVWSYEPFEHLFFYNDVYTRLQTRVIS